MVVGMMLLAAGDTLFVKYSASEMSVLELRPNNYLFKKAIEEAISGGLARLDLGISNEERLIRFKEHLGATPLAEPDVPRSAATSAGSVLYRFFA